MVLEISMIVLGSFLLILGIIGCVVPVIPGPVLSFIALLLISIPSGFSLFHPLVLAALAAAAVLSQVLDNIFPLISSKQAGAGKAGIWGSILGMIAGTFFFPPLGVFIGAFAGALAGEMLFNKDNEKPLKAALAVFRGTLIGIIIKLAISGVIGTFFVLGIRQMF